MELFTRKDAESAICIEYNGDKNGNRIPDLDEIGIRHLSGDGDFRSQECIDLLQKADIVVTNPPFSLFREYVEQLMKYRKKFLIIGNQNAVTYKTIFPLLKDGKMWQGYGFPGDAAFFINTKYEDYAKASSHKEGMIRVSGIVWYTNLEIKKRHEDLPLYKPYSPAEYPKYDNFDAIHVKKTSDIPTDYAGAMGVPITFFGKYNPEQFELLGHLGSYAPDGYSLCSALYLKGRKMFKRIVIRNKRLKGEK